jgi:nucleoside 2-deoxyribosyltransferase
VKYRLDQNIADKRRVAYALAARTARGAKHAIFIVDNAAAVAALAPRQTNWTFLTVDELVKETPSAPLEMLDSALFNLTRQLTHPSEFARIAPQDCWKLLAYSPDSLGYVIKQLCGLGFIKDEGADPATSYSTRRFEVQALGWEKIASLQSIESATKRQAFVAMWFDPQMEETYLNAIKPAVEADGTMCVRIDLKEHNNKICDEIIAEIRRSKYVVADFSGDRGGVYYEAGFAFGLGRPVIWTVRKSDLPKVHFDTRQYNHLVYETAVELREKLTNRIKATIV